MSRAIMRAIYSHSPAFTGNGFQLQMTHRAFVHAMLTRTLFKWVEMWISSKSWLWKWGSKTAIWIVGFFTGCGYLFLLRPALHLIWGTVEHAADTHIERFQTFELELYTVYAQHNFPKCKIMNKDYVVVDVVPACLLKWCCTVSLMLVWNQGWSANHNNKQLLIIITIITKNSLICKKLNMK